jgi:NADPH2:quinone reductase
MAGWPRRSSFPRGAIPLPAERSFEDGSALLLTYATSIHALYDRGRLKAGETLLVLGAAGGVGLAAVELGKALARGSSPRCRRRRKPQAAREAGADEAIVYPRGPFDKDGPEGARAAVQGGGRAAART